MNNVDISGWKAKSFRERSAIAEAIRVSVEWGLDTLLKTTIKNVSGPRYGFRKGKKNADVRIPIRGPLTNAGKLPVPVVYGILRRSIRMKHINSYLGAVYQDNNIAPYGKFVHDGTRYMKKREFLGDAVTGMRPIFLQKAKKELLAVVRDIGRK